MLLSLHAVIMAGGEGVRLRPLTVALLKPLVPLVGEPVMGYALKLLKKHAITDVTATLCYQPRKIREAFGRGEKYGVKLRYCEETTPLGTAGSVKAAAKGEGTTLVLSGDGLTDADLTAALNYHKEKKALATILLKRSASPLSYGVVMRDLDGHVTRFVEKPTWNKTYSDLVNTGVYFLEKEIFEHIPAHGTPDFGRDIFPALLEKGLPVYGFELGGYWCDVGDRRSYLSAQEALLRGEVKIPCAAGLSSEANIDATAVVRGACMIGIGAVIGKGARVVDSVIGEGAVVADGAVVEKSCLWKNAVVERKARVTGAILCDGASIRQNAIVQEGCAIGSRAVIGADSDIRPGVSVFPSLRVPSGAILEKSMHTGDHRAYAWTDDGVECATPTDACEIVEALFCVTRARQFAVSHDGEGLWLARVVESALAAQGAHVLSLGEGTHPMLLSLTRLHRAQVGVFAQGRQIRLCDAKSDPFDKKKLSAMDTALLKREQSSPSQTGDIRFLDGALAHALSCLPPGGTRALWTPLAVVADRPILRDMIAWGFERMNVRSARVVTSAQKTLRSDEIGLFLSPDGTQILPYTERMTLHGGRRTLLLLKLSLLSGAKKIYDLPGVPRAAGRMATLTEPDDSIDCLRQKRLTTDGVAAAFALAEALKTHPLDALLSALPPLYVYERSLPCDENFKSGVLRRAGETQLPHVFDDGVLIDHEGGSARIVPDAVRSEIHITSEAASAEIAQELCDFYVKKLGSQSG